MVSPKRARLLTSLAGVLWGTVFPVLKLALQGFSPLEVAFLRALIGSLSLGLVYSGMGHWEIFCLQGRALPRVFMLALTGAGAFWPIQAFSVAHSTSVNAAFLVATYPVVVTVLAPVLLGEALSREELVGLVLALSGAYVVISGGRVLGLFASRTLLGDGLALLASFCFGGYILLSKRWSPGLRLSPETLSFYTFALSLPPLLVAVGFGPVTLGSRQSPPAPTAWGAVVWLGVMATAGAFMALNLGLKEAAASQSVVHLLFVPLVAALLSYLLLGEEIMPAHIAGGGLIVGGILAPNWWALSGRGERKWTP